MDFWMNCSVSLKPAPTRWPEFPPLGLIAEAISYRLPRPVTEIVQYASGACHPICPRCNIPMEREYMNFCDRCGQKLNWSALHLARVRTWGR